MHRFALNIAQKCLAAWIRRDPLGSLQRCPRLPSWAKGKEGSGRAGKGEEREGGMGTGGGRKEGEEEGRWKGGRYFPPFRFYGYARATTAHNFVLL